MPTSFQAAAVLVLALVPGALYIWSFERQAGRWGIGLSDRIFRFVGASAIIHALLAPATYWFWSTQWPRLRQQDDPSWWLWALAMGYVALPLLAGSWIGCATRTGSGWALFFTGPDPAPRAWDHLFQGKRDGWVRLRLKSGTWVGGAYATSETGLRSYTAGYPEEQDLFLATTVEVDPGTGEFLFDESGNVRLQDGGLLVRWEEVEYLQFIDA
ncbi:DUF6338 family protein [Georgenia sp. SUBG003]|uniref:DUF6338 family protein n=1 Tax=Georgenia sp. SUBG003 TaxID=1497974 RepID=UPI0004D3DB5E|nr:hypothetical protein DA06_20445 [Georgenia sp. SUBG003]